MNDFLNQFPYSDFHEMNLDWIIAEVKRVASEIKDFKAANTLNYAGIWDISQSYAAWSIVLNPDTAFLMLSKIPVPAGIDINNSEYWEYVAPFHVDTYFSTTSENPVANKTITAKVNEIDAALESINTTLAADGQTIEDHETSISALQTGLANETSNREDADSLLSARIDNIENLTPGSTSLDAEVVDIRTGYNAATYASAGTSVRTQVSLLNRAVGSPVSIIPGSYSSSLWTTNYYSCLVKVNPGDTFSITAGASSCTYGAFKSFTFVPTVGDAAPYSDASGWGAFTSASAGETETGTLPADCNYLYLYAGTNTNYTRLPVSCIINGIDVMKSNFELISDLFSTDEPLKVPYGIAPFETSLFKKSANLFSDFCSHITNKYYTSDVVPAGPIRLTNATGWQGWLIPVKPNTTYIMGPLDFRIYCFGKDYIFTERFTEVSDDSTNTITTGPNTYWISLTERSTRDMSNFMIIEGETYPETYISGYPEFVKMPYQPGSDKTIAFMGDSITAGVGATKLFHMYLHDLLGYTCLNYGFGGSGWYRNSESDNSGRQGNGTPGRGDPTTPETFFTPNNINARLTELSAENIDGIVIFAGTNDYGNNVSMSDFESAVDSALTYVQSYFPAKPCLVITPIQRKTGATANTKGLTLRDYCDKIIEKCTEYGIPYIDAYTMSGIHPAIAANLSAYFSIDASGLHPDNAGHKRIASITKTLLSDIMSYLTMS